MTSSSPTAVTAAEATALAQVPSFTQPIVVADTAANLLVPANNTALAAVSSVQLTGTSNNVTPQQAATLLAMPGFSIALGATLNVSGASASLAFANAVGGGITIGGNGHSANSAAGDYLSLAQGGAVTEVDDSRVDLRGNTIVATEGNADILALIGSADLVQMIGTGSSVWIGGNGTSATDKNDDYVSMTQGGVVHEVDVSRVDVTGDNGIAIVGNNDLFGIVGRAESILIAGTGSSVWIGGNGKTATDPNDDIVALQTAGVIHELDNSRLDVAGNGATVFVGNNDILGLNGNAAIVLMQGTGSSIWIGGNGQSATTANADYVSSAFGAVVHEFDNSVVNIVSSNSTAFVGTNDVLSLAGSNETVLVQGTGSSVWIGGNGESASNANDDFVYASQPGVVHLLDQSRVDVSGDGVTVMAGNYDSLGLTGSTASVSAGLSASTMSFIGTPNQVVLSVGSYATVSYALQSASGIETISNFQYGLDELHIDLMGAATSVLKAAATTVNGVAAISLYSQLDPTHGVILTGMTGGQTAGDLLANHTTFVGGVAMIK